tara:strand:- start:681 stop:1520 length:840 start_codon:yes stop_codon:yes gene_type:complete
MKIILLCSSQANQKALAHKIHKKFELDKIIVKIPGGNAGRKLIYKKFFYKLNSFLASLFTLFQFRNAWFNMLNYYLDNYPDFPIEPEAYVTDINQMIVGKIIDNSKPDLVLISGTNLLKEDILNKIIKYGKAMNLHTGISPYIKGGPDCTYWAFYLKEFGLIGNTIMWIDKGIDSGNIITTEQTDIRGNETLLELKIKTMNHGHELYVKAINRFFQGLILPSIPQSTLSPSRLFLAKHWGFKNIIIAVYNFHLYFNPKSTYLNSSYRFISINESNQGNG